MTDSEIDAKVALAMELYHRAPIATQGSPEEYEARLRAALQGRVSVSAASGQPASGLTLDLLTVNRLKPLATQCLYAIAPDFRGCGCRWCWHRLRDVSLRECLECSAELVSLPGPEKSVAST